MCTNTYVINDWTQARVIYGCERSLIFIKHRATVMTLNTYDKEIYEYI